MGGHLAVHCFGDRRSFWSTAPASLDSRLPRLNSVMSRDRFELILSHLSLAGESPDLTDRFFCVRGLIKAFNEHMPTRFRCSGRVCIDESMVPWTVRATCPGWMIMQNKPTPKGNEYHTMADCETGVLVYMEIVEGRHQPESVVHKYSNLGKTPGLVARACTTAQIQHTKRHVFLDSGFCVVGALTTLTNLGLLGTICIKKRRYWPAGIPGDDIVNDFLHKPMFQCRATKLIDGGHPFHVFAMRDTSHVTMFMSTCGSTSDSGRKSFRSQVYDDEGKKLPAPKPLMIDLPVILNNYYTCRHAVDDNNHTRQATADIETAWTTREWVHRQFAFVIGVCVANAHRAYSAFGPPSPPRKSDFQRELGVALMRYSLGVAQRATSRKRGPHSPVLQVEHEAELIPPGMKWVGNRWVSGTKTRNRQLTCIICKRRVRYVCICNRTRGCCRECIPQHQALEDEHC